VYSIHPTRCGTLTASKSALTYRTDRDLEVEFAVYAFLIVADDPDNDTVILVDTGLNSEKSAYMRERDRNVGLPGGGPEPLLDGLMAEGYAPDDVDVVVLTHLHHDHTANISLFENSEFVVQERELAAARDPVPILSKPYRDETLCDLEGLTLTVADGDTELRPGIDLLLTPGHTEGMQSVVVETAGGLVALVGDLAYSQHNLDPGLESIVDVGGRELAVTPREMSYIPPGTHVDVGACYESVEKVRRRVGPAGRLVSSHDYEAVDEI